MPDDSDSSIDHLIEQYNAIITDLWTRRRLLKNSHSTGVTKATVVRRRLPQVKKETRWLEIKFKTDVKMDSRARWHSALKSSRKLAHFKAAAVWERNQGI